MKHTGPVWMTTSEVHRVHEPEPVDSRVEVSVDLDSILRPEAERGEVDPRWASFWHGTLPQSSKFVWQVCSKPSGTKPVTQSQ